MHHDPQYPRQVHYDSTVEQHILEMLDQYEDLDRLILALEWFLSNYPDNPRSKDIGMGYRVVESRRVTLFDTPSVRLIYTYDDKSVTFFSIYISD